MGETKTYIEGEEYSEQTVRLDRQTQRAARASRKIEDLRAKLEKFRHQRTIDEPGA